METIAGLLGGLGLLGVVAAALIALVVLLILPWWAIIDCIVSARTNGAKAFGVIFLVLTWGLGSVVYGLFFSVSRALRIFTVVAIVGFGAILVPSVISLFTGAGLAGKAQNERNRLEHEELLSQFQPGTISIDAIDAFHAVHFMYDGRRPRSASLAQFTLSGPDLGVARDIDKDVRHVAFDAENERYFALTSHAFGTITPSSGRFTEVQVDPSLGDFSWPKGIAFDRTRRQVYVMTSHVYTRFYRFDPRTSDWQSLPTEIRDLTLAALAHSATEDCLYGLEHRYGDTALTRIHRFNDSGANIGSIDLEPAIPVPDGPEAAYQLHESGGMLVLVLPPFDLGRGHPGEAEAAPTESRVFVVDPATGNVLLPDVDPVAVASSSIIP
jgi:hypothetical protein